MFAILWSGFTCSTWRAFIRHNVPYSEKRVQVLAREGPSCASTWRAFMCQNVSYSESRLQVLAGKGSLCAQQMSPFRGNLL